MAVDLELEINNNLLSLVKKQEKITHELKGIMNIVKENEKLNWISSDVDECLDVSEGLHLLISETQEMMGDLF